MQGCQPCSTAANCNDSNVCTSDHCHPIGVCYHGNVAGSCDDGDPCTSNDVCSAGVCSGADIPGCINCASAAECNDNNPCTSNTCVGGVCQFPPDDGIACDDGNICTETDTCSGGICAGTPISGCDACTVHADCNDGNPCTTDSCHPLGVCIYANNKLPCNDGIACTQNDICSGGICAGTSTPDGGACDDGSVCTAGETCTGGVCGGGTPTNEGATCNDGNLCTLNDTCAAGVCAGTPMDCSALNDQCNVGQCNPTTGACEPVAINEGGPCSDGQACTENDTCVNGVCETTPIDCSMLNGPCGTGVCNASTGLCEVVPMNEGQPCDDGSVCTANDSCVNGFCTGPGVDCSGLDGPCVRGACHPIAGVCEALPANEGGACNDSDLCTTGDVCTGGACGGTPVDCSGLATVCRSAACNPSTGSCETTSINKGAACDDGNLCTQTDVCTGGVCAGMPADCSALNSGCLVGVCNTGTGACEQVPAGEGGACDDGNLCTQNDICISGSCAGTAVNCSSLNTACTLGVCNGSTGQCQAIPTNPGGSCNDNNRCTINDRCNAGVCSGTPKDCSAFTDACNIGTCNLVNGQCEATPANEGAPCNDGLACTINDVCVNGDCEGTSLNPETVSLIWSPPSQTIMIGSTFQVTLIARSDTCFTIDVGSIQAILNWDETRIRFLGHTDNGPYAWIYSGFPNDQSLDGLNAPFNGTIANDGDALYQAIASFVNGAPASPSGLTVTTFTFEALGLASNTVVTIPPAMGNYSVSEVLGEGIDEDITGSLGTATVSVVECTTKGQCNDGNPCTTDACVSGVCVHTNNSLPCSDGLFCTANDVCSGGTCVGGANPCSGGLLCSETLDACVQCLTNANCNDGNVCTTDTCNSSGTCVFTNNSASCNDGLFCTPTDTCSGGTCQGGGIACPGQFCNETLDACVECLTNAHCNDGNVCTTDSCNASGSCVHANNTAACDDGQFCTVTDICSNGSCVGSGTPCLGGLFCNEANDTCVQCLTNGHCGDGNVCTTDTCVSGSCQHSNNTFSCDDGLFCTTGDACSNGACVSGSGVNCPGLLCDEAGNRCVECFTASDCNDGAACSTEQCNNGVCNYTLDHASCNDGLFCTGVETCVVDTGCVSPGSPCDSPALCDEASDFCRCGAPTAVTDGPRHVGVTPAGGATPVAILVDSADPDLFCLPKYVAADGRFSDTPVFRTPAQWGTVHLADKYVEPATTYSIQSDCRAQPTDPENLSPPVSATTFLWGDIDNTGIPDVDDLIRMVQGFASLISYDADLVPCESDIVVDVDDLLAFVAAFGFAPYPCPAPCP
jgi:Cys-rich repeat protein